MVALRAVCTGALTLATLVAGLVLLPSDAQADSYVSPDASGDVVQVNLQAETSMQVPDRTEGDITSSGVAHGKRRVAMATRHRELTRTGAGTVHLFRIGSRNRVHVVTLVARPGHWQGSASMKTGQGRSVSCRGLRWSIRYDDDLVRLSVPRRCLGRPSWVHVGMAEKHVEETSNFLDDAQTDGRISENPEFGPRVRR